MWSSTSKSPPQLPPPPLIPLSAQSLLVTPWAASLPRKLFSPSPPMHQSRPQRLPRQSLRLPVPRRCPPRNHPPTPSCSPISKASWPLIHPTSASLPASLPMEPKHIIERPLRPTRLWPRLRPSLATALHPRPRLHAHPSSPKLSSLARNPPKTPWRRA